MATLERGLVAQDARVGGAVQRRGIEQRRRRARALADQRAPLLGEDLAGHDQLRRAGRPGEPVGQTRVDHVLQEGRIAEQHDLLEGGAELAHDAQDLGDVVAGSDDRDRIAARGEVAAALAVYMPPTQVPSAKHTTARVRRRRRGSCRRRPARSGGRWAARRRGSAARRSAGRSSPRRRRPCRRLRARRRGTARRSGYAVAGSCACRRAAGARNRRSSESTLGRCRARRETRA